MMAHMRAVTTCAVAILVLGCSSPSEGPGALVLVDTPTDTAAEPDSATDAVRATDMPIRADTTSALDIATQPDSTAASDTNAAPNTTADTADTADTATAAETVKTPDTAVTPDAAAPQDTIAAPDAAPTPDTATTPDTAATADTATTPDTTTTPDTALAPDTATTPDTAATPDTGPPKPFCGDGVCTAPEHCGNCLKDCGCGPAELCSAGKCASNFPPGPMPAGCMPNGRVLFYNPSGWARIGKALAAKPPPCANVYLHLPAIAGDKTWPRGDPAVTGVHALGGRFAALAEFHWQGWDAISISAGRVARCSTPTARCSTSAATMATAWAFHPAERSAHTSRSRCSTRPTPSRSGAPMPAPAR